MAQLGVEDDYVLDHAAVFQDYVDVLRAHPHPGQFLESATPLFGQANRRHLSVPDSRHHLVFAAAAAELAGDGGFGLLETDLRRVAGKEERGSELAIDTSPRRCLARFSERLAVASQET